MTQDKQKQINDLNLK